MLWKSKAEVKQPMLTRSKDGNAPPSLAVFLDFRSRLTQPPTLTLSFHSSREAFISARPYYRTPAGYLEKRWLLPRRQRPRIQRMKGCYASITRCCTKRRSSIADKRKTINLGSTGYIIRGGRIRKLTLKSLENQNKATVSLNSG